MIPIKYSVRLYSNHASDVLSTVVFWVRLPPLLHGYITGLPTPLLNGNRFRSLPCLHTNVLSALPVLYGGALIWIRERELVLFDDEKRYITYLVGARFDSI